ncbi:squalene synthase HpnD [Thioalkalivibrio sp. K90mix]|uniref:presqualene diphosphate synthase HpnD n=1 Tax=Thioalkalivibrio sp. (strain K90mix) TaxID=396595 RepID=UPI000195A6FB|nr:presqualene diphosphate synthase HpnD [Thioalkalivibrio sp. K90mix]ADC72016.1 squalene synthase HpnD [Thioalkalivibrio sp. K90mix]
MSPDEYCEEKAAKSGSSFYYAFRFLEPDRRRAITALYAFCREVDDIVDEVREESVARTKLQWWREEIERLFDHQPRHPITQALQPHLAPFDLSREYFDEIIDGMQMDLDYDSYPDFTTLSLYCYRAASVVGILSAHIFGFSDRRTLKYAHDLGMALQLTNILRDVHEDAMRGRVYIPLDELKKHGVKPEEFQVNVTDDRHRALFAEQAERARRYYQRAEEHLPAEDRYPQRPGLIMAAIYRTLLDEIQDDGYRVLEHRVRLTPIRKLWIAWRTARRLKREYRRAG